MDKHKDVALEGLTCLKEAVITVLAERDDVKVKEITLELGLPVDTCPCRRIVNGVLHLLKKEGKVTRTSKTMWALNQKPTP